MDKVILCGQYKVDIIKKELGRGTFATVYLGYNTLNEKVAIKVISKNNILRDNTQHITNEINVHTFLKDNPHKNIVKCYDIIDDSNYVYIILEYCNSGSLHDFLTLVKNTENGCLSEAFAQFYFAQLIEGVQFLKKNNITHRDIKPKNILLLNNKEIKIADFGTAIVNRVFDIHDTVCGSPLSMAPEILSGYIRGSSRVKYTDTIDIWSLGTILYELLYGKNPFEVDNYDAHDIHFKITSGKVNVPNYQPNKVMLSNQCVNLVKSMMQMEDSRIKWVDLFNHPWIKNPKYMVVVEPVQEHNLHFKEEVCSNFEIIEDYFSFAELESSIFEIDV